MYELAHHQPPVQRVKHPWPAMAGEGGTQTPAQVDHFARKDARANSLLWRVRYSVRNVVEGGLHAWRGLCVHVAVNREQEVLVVLRHDVVCC